MKRRDQRPKILHPEIKNSWIHGWKNLFMFPHQDKFDFFPFTSLSNGYKFHRISEPQLLQPPARRPKE
jgi:hypothetical protein